MSAPLTLRRRAVLQVEAFVAHYAAHRQQSNAGARPRCVGVRATRLRGLVRPSGLTARRFEQPGLMLWIPSSAFPPHRSPLWSVGTYSLRSHGHLSTRGHGATAAARPSPAMKHAAATSDTFGRTQPGRTSISGPRDRRCDLNSLNSKTRCLIFVDRSRGSPNASAPFNPVISIPPR
jgi:hypothetical protein